jgi:hypothetical protein
LQISRVCDFELEGGVRPASRANHFRRAVHTQYLRAGLGNLRGQMARPASDIQNALAGLRGED